MMPTSARPTPSIQGKRRDHEDLPCRGFRGPAVSWFVPCCCEVGSLGSELTSCLLLPAITPGGAASSGPAWADPDHSGQRNTMALLAPRDAPHDPSSPG